MCARILEKFYNDHLKSATDLTPASAYALLCKSWTPGNGDVYLSHAISSGGFKDTDLCNPGQEIESNCTLAQAIIRELVGARQIPGDHRCLVPSDIGKVKGFEQIQFNIFWFFVIAGVTAENALDIEDRVKPDQRINDRTIPPSNKLTMYEDLLYQLLEYKGVVAPVYQLVQVFANTSLGSRFEHNLAIALNIPVQRVELNTAVSTKSKFQIIHDLNNQGVDFPMVNATDSDHQFLLQEVSV